MHPNLYQYLEEQDSKVDIIQWAPMVGKTCIILMESEEATEFHHELPC